MSEQNFESLIKVVSGNPSDEELATIIAILQANHRNQMIQAAKKAKPASSSWARNAGHLRSDLRPGVGQWKAAFRAGLE